MLKIRSGFVSNSSSSSFVISVDSLDLDRYISVIKSKVERWGHEMMHPGANMEIKIKNLGEVVSWNDKYIGYEDEYEESYVDRSLLKNEADKGKTCILIHCGNEDDFISYMLYAHGMDAFEWPDSAKMIEHHG